MTNLPIAEACLRNQEPIFQVLEKLFVNTNTVLELGSGTGQHAVYVCQKISHLQWQPSEMPERVKEVEAWRESENLSNILKTKAIDVRQKQWGLQTQYDAVFTANTIHYICWKRAEALLKGVSEHLNTAGRLVIYGPFNIDKQYTSEGNRSLDQWLKQRDDSSGIKDLNEFILLAEKYHFKFIESIEMPANNLMLSFDFIKEEA